MISNEQFEKELYLIIKKAIREDIGNGDLTALSCTHMNTKRKAKLLVKEDSIIAGVDFISSHALIHSVSNKYWSLKNIEKTVD